MEAGDDTANNGNVMTQTIRVGGTAFTATQTYTYGAFNRLATVVEGATNWKQGFGYDRWGNRWIVPGDTSGIGIPPGTPNGASWYTRRATIE